MTTKAKLLIAVLAFAGLSIGLMMASEQTSYRPEVLQLAAGFLGTTPTAVEGLDVKPVAGEEGLYIAEGTPVAEPGGGPQEEVRLTINLPLGFVARADWPGRLACDPPPPDFDESPLCEVAETFARSHCPFWTTDFEFSSHTAVPANKQTYHAYTWALPPQPERGACRVSVGLCAVDQRVFRYDCSYTSSEELEGVAVTEAQALEIAKALLTKQHQGAASITACRFMSHNRKYRAPVWYVPFLVEREGMETWVDAVFVNARNGEVLYPPTE